MATSYEAALAALYRSPPEQFVEERKRLAAALKAEGDKANAARLAKLPRPTLSVWAVNQLWQRERDLFEQLFASAERLRRGDLGGTSAHREALAQLRAHAAGVLVEAGHPATEATQRRVSATLAALAAAGSFEPDPPGALTSDRDPPGFDDAALSLAALSAAVPSARTDALANKPTKSGTPPGPSSAKRTQRKERDATAPAPRNEQKGREAQQRAASVEQARKQAEREAAEARKQAEREIEQRRLEEQRTVKRAERERLQSALKAAQHEAELAQRTSERLRRELAEAELAAERARTHVNELTARLRSPELD
ncbi:MAG TPA: hypothetical protein VER33_03445 [Polyangiaceae bacterium]|nr:hypothetical protein [Polyangiaceae bacterium]